jgi:YidC/Oxa1 family membrane protein insertase
MDKRFLLALVLTAAVVIGFPLLFPGAPTTAPVAGRDSTVATQPAGAAPGAPAAVPAAPGAPAAPGTAGTPGAAPAAVAPLAADSAAARAAAAAPALAAAPAETTTVATPLGSYRFSSVGAAPVSAQLARFRSLRPGAGEVPVELARPGEPLLRYRLFMRGDTISLHDVPFRATRGAAPAGGVAPLVYEGAVDGVQLRIAYAFVPDSYQVRVRTDVVGAPANSFLFLDVAQGLASAEADVEDDQRHMAYAYKPTAEGASSIGFGKLDPGEAQLVEGPLSWAVLKNKYFVFGLLAPERGTPFSEMHVTGGARTGKEASNARGTVVAPLGATGSAEFTIYAGPQEWRRLVAMGRDFENVNPYGGWLQGMVQPFATIVMRALLWLRDTTQLNYGWVLVIFGVAVRLAMWPLNQSAMRSTMKMQRLQPEMQALQKKHASDPQKQQQEMMRLYKEHGMSPFSPIMGCLPMLLPMPILFALFFVFQNTIEFRGVPFLWLNDISLHDPYYVMPLLMGLTTFLVSWIGMRGAPPNPQAKLFAYVLPATFAIMFAKMASGLHVYYTVQNLAALPQQWLLARERTKAAAAPVVEGPVRTPPAAPARKRA